MSHILMMRDRDEGAGDGEHEKGSSQSEEVV